MTAELIPLNDNNEARDVTERDETFQHISRTNLPWRAATRTRCGLIVESRPRYLSHFVTCVARSEFRGNRKRKREAGQ